MNIFNIEKNVRMSTLVNINLSASQWDLHTECFPRYMIEKVASFLNSRFNQGYNKGMSKQQLEESMNQLMNQFSVYGANDRETCRVLNNLLKKVYP